jgi:hypothetical protein
MSGEVFTAVLETRTLAECPRTVLGFACVADTGYTCACKDVRSTESEVITDTRGQVLVLTLELFPNGDTKSVTNALRMTGGRADWKVAGGGINRGPTLSASLDLWRPENKNLREYLAAA